MEIDSDTEAEAIEYLLQCNINVNQVTNYFRSPLLESKTEELEKIIVLLLKAGADIYYRSEKNKPPIVEAVLCRNIHFLNFLYTMGANFSVVQDYIDVEDVVDNTDIRNFLYSTNGLKGKRRLESQTSYYYSGEKRLQTIHF